MSGSVLDHNYVTAQSPRETSTLLGQNSTPSTPDPHGRKLGRSLSEIMAAVPKGFGEMTNSSHTFAGHQDAKPQLAPRASQQPKDSKNLHKLVEQWKAEGTAYTEQVRLSIDLMKQNYAPVANKQSESTPRHSLRELPRSRSTSMSLQDELEAIVVDGTPAVRPPPKVEQPPTVPESPVKPSQDLEPAHEEHHGGNKEGDILKNFPISKGLTSAEAEGLLAQYGRNELPEKITPKWLIFLRLLYQPMPCMIWIAAIVEIAIQNYDDMAILVAINLINASLSFYETTKAGDAIAALKASLKPTSICMRDGKWNNLFDARLLVPGDLIELASGAAVPADCMLNHGTIDVDESAMTGESLPATLHEREMAKMGGTVARGETHATVVFTGKDTFFGKTASMLGDSGEQSNLQKLLIRIIVVLCVMALVLVLTAFGYLLGKGIKAKTAASFAVVVLVASIPMAVEIVTTTTLAIGSKFMSKHGAIVSRLAAIDDLAGLNMLCSDKTGTLTKNKMTIQDDAPTYEPGLTQMDLMKYAALAAKWESPPKDALDTLFLRCHLWYPGINAAVQEHNNSNPNQTQAQKDEWYNHQVNEKLQEALVDYESLAFLPFDPRFKRTESTIRTKSTGAIFKVTKGAPHIIQALDQDKEKGHRMHDKVTSLGEDGIRSVTIAISEPLTSQWKVGVEPADQKLDVVWHIVGMLTFLDPPRDDTKETIAKSQSYGVPVRMITGDNILIAKKTCKDLAMGVLDRPEWPHIQGPDHLPMLDADGKTPKDLVKSYGPYIENADGFAQVFPEHKFLVVETFRQLGYKCGMTGDGVNDAPALKKADVGIAVAGATDAARAAADIVLTQEGLSTIILGLEISRAIFARMKSFLTYRIAATLQLLTFFFIAVFAFKPNEYAELHTPSDPVSAWPPFFSLPVIFLMIITLINDGTLISIGYDHAVPSKYPERWVLPIIFMVATALAAISCLSSLLLLHFCLDSWNPSGLFQSWHIDGLEYGQIVNVIFLKVAVSDILTLFSSRTAQQFFFQRAPHKVLLIACLCALSITTLLSVVWPCGTLDDVPVCGLGYKGQKIALWVWIYCFIVFIIQDVVKVGVWRLIMHYNLFNINNEVKSKGGSLLEIAAPASNQKLH